MLTQVFELLARIREGISKPDFRVTIEEYDLVEPGDAIKFQFRWYEAELLTLTLIISRMEVERIRGEEEIIVERLIADINKELSKKENHNDNSV